MAQKDVTDDISGNILQKSKNRKWYVWLFIALLAALLLSNMAGETIKSLFNSLLSGLTPIIIGIVVAFLLVKPVNLIENKLLKNAFVGNPHSKGYKRAISLIICYLVLIALIVVLLVVSIPQLISTVEYLANSTTQAEMINQIKTSLTTFLQNLGWFDDDSTWNAINTGIDNLVAGLSNAIPELINNLASVVLDTVAIIGNIFMGLLISFLILLDKELISRTSKRMTYAYNSRKRAEELITVTQRSNEMLNQYIISSLIVMAIIFGIAWIAFVLLGVPYAFVLAAILAIISIIPYLGGFIACIPIALITLVFSTIDMMFIAMLVAVLDWAIVTTFIPPFIMSKRMNTRALVVVVSIIIGGALFGLWGMILAAPIASVIMIVLQERLEVREAMREHEEIVASTGFTEEEMGSISEMLDLTQDNDEVKLLDKDEQEYQLLKKARKRAQIAKDADKKLETLKTIKKTERMTKKDEINE